MSVESLLKEHQQSIQKLRQTMRRESQKVLNSLWIEIKKEVPNLDAISWTQYTPYFNDGEECIFGVNEPKFYSLEYDIDELMIGNKWVPQNATYNENTQLDSLGNWHYNKKYFEEAKLASAPITKEQANLLDIVSASIQSEEFEDILLSTFGNHVEIEISFENGEVLTVVEEYDHE